MDLYAIYLRKSRMDLEAEAHGEGETLKRHETALLSLAKQRCYTVGEIYREVVSGDTIEGRPEVQRLLADVESGRWKGVLVMEESRLARGDTMDQGRVQQAFYYSHTLIITPNKTFNPDSEADQEYFEFGLFMSRREYKLINRRLQRGRLASVKEGKWVGAYAPYGYRKVKLEREKGYTLEPVPEEARIVKQIYDWYLQNIPLYHIAKKLTNAGIQTSSGQVWTTQGIRQILDNPAYCGMIRYGYRKTEKKPSNGHLIKHHYRAESEEGINLFPGRHPVIIDRAVFDAAQAKRCLRRDVPGPKVEKQLMNPFAGLMFCAECGRAIQRNPGKPGSTERVLCMYPACSIGSSLIPNVEQLILDSMREQLAELQMPKRQQETHHDEELFLHDSLDSLTKQLEKLSIQKARAFELVEQGVYTPEIFAARMESLINREERVSVCLAEAQKQLKEQATSACHKKELLPQIQRVISVYPILSSPIDKNNLLKAIVASMNYYRLKGRRKDEMSLKIFYLF